MYRVSRIFSPRVVSLCAASFPIRTIAPSCNTIVRAIPLALQSTNARSIHTSSIHTIFSSDKPPVGAEHEAGWTPGMSMVPLDTIDLSTEVPPLPKHVKHGYEVYHSIFEIPVQVLKSISFTSAMLSIMSVPILVFFAEQHMPLAGRLAIAGTVLVYGVGSTLLLTHFLKSYVVRIFARRDPTITVDPSMTDEEKAAKQWIITIQTLNLIGRPVHMRAHHSDFSPLYSRLFNNTRLETELDGGAKRDLFIHLDQAEHRLLLPWWQRPTVISSKPSKLELLMQDGAELAATKAKAAAPEEKITKDQALKEIDEMRRKWTEADEKKKAESKAAEEVWKKKQEIND